MKYNKIKAVPVESGVILKDHYNLKFREHVWNRTPTLQSEGLSKDNKSYIKWEYTTDELISMVYQVVKVDEEDAYYIKNKYGKKREKYKTSKTAYEKLYNDYYQEIYPSISKEEFYNLDENKIRLLVYCKRSIVVGSEKKEEIEVPAGTLPSVYSKVDYPLHNEFLVDQDGEFVLNTGYSFETLESQQDNNKAKDILYMIYINLCAYKQPPNSSIIETKDYLLDIVMNNTYTEQELDFKFVINWVAALVQKPGINLMTNLWFAGAYQGIGKGTLVNLLKAILGEDRAALLKSNMILGSFNGPLDNKFILEINEKQEGITPLQMTNWLKSFSQEPTIQIEKKGMEPHTRVNMINVLGTCQFPEDVFKIEDEDRRNTIYQTIDQDTDPDLIAKQRAKDIAVGLKGDDIWAKSFAWVLERVDIDWNLMSTARKTNSYNAIKTEQTQALNPLYYWAQSRFIEYAKSSQSVQSKVMRDEYLESNGSYRITQNTFNKKLKELSVTDGICNFKLKKPANVLTAYFAKYKKTDVKTKTKTSSRDLFTRTNTADVLKNIKEGIK